MKVVSFVLLISLVVSNVKQILWKRLGEEVYCLTQTIKYP